MAFEPKKFSDIFQAMRERTSSALTDFEVGSVTRTMYESFAYEMGLLYQKMNLVYLSAYVDSAQGSQLDNVVAVLGIKRSLPDFSVGEVIFERDKGNEDLLIPQGTLVATEDTPENPKKVYQTIEAVTLAKDQATVTTKVQALERGEEWDTAPETIVVMPRPISGIKSVNNPQEIKLKGRKRENDDDLRRRAKNTLLSSGKANQTSLENAVLSLPGVLDVKVQEAFHFPKGKINITRTEAIEKTLAKGTRLVFGNPPDQQFYALRFDLTFDQDVFMQSAEIQSLVEGKAGELPSNSSLNFTDNALADYTAITNSNIEQSQFGIVEVFVDASDFDKIKNSVRSAIDKVRAAGIYVMLEAAKKMEVDGVFRIAINEQLDLTPEERTIFEKQIQTEIEDFFLSVKMGEPFVFSKMIKTILSVEGVENLEDFNLTTIRELTSKETEYAFSNNKIEIEAFERFKARHICVASEDKQLVVNMDVQLSEPTLAADASDVERLEALQAKADAVRVAVEAYFNGLNTGTTVERAQIESEIQGEVIANTLKLRPESWCPNPNLNLSEPILSIPVKFVEKPTLGNVFAYRENVELNGALRLILPSTVKGIEKGNIRTAVRDAMNQYLKALAPQESIVLEELLVKLRAVAQVLEVQLDAEDLEVKINGAALDLPRLNEDQTEITIGEFEKAVLAGNFVIATDISKVNIVVEKITILLYHQGNQPDSNAVKGIQSQIAYTINTFLSGVEIGQNVSYEALKTAIQNLSFDYSFALQELKLTATPEVDNNSQNVAIASPKDIKIRVMELAFINPIEIPEGDSNNGDSIVQVNFEQITTN